MSIPFEDIRRWLFDAALPFWAERGVDRLHGGFIEALDLQGRDAGLAFKRVRVIARQTYVFAHAAHLGVPGAREIAVMGADHLLERAWLGPERGWARRLDRAGAVLDPTPDLYDAAFALFALAWAYRAAPEPRFWDRALETLGVLERNFRVRPGLGYWHALPPEGPRQQNPHMHLLEAALVWVEARREPPFIELATELIALCLEKFYDPASKTLAEYYDPALNRATGDAGRLIEPGHQFEWAWILAQAVRLGVAPAAQVDPAISGLVAFAEAHGIDPASRAVFNQVREDGAALDRGSRTWPNTERIKAHVAMFERFGADPRGPAGESARLLLQRYLGVTPRGAWIDAFDGAGAPIPGPIPASTLYHVVLAFAELLRIEPALRARFG